MSARKSKQAIKARREEQGNKGFLPLEKKQALDRYSRSKNPQCNQVTWLNI